MRSEEVRCGLDIVLEVVGGKWKLLLLWELQDGARRFGELRRSMDGISEKVLIQQLRDLEADGIVHRQQYNEVPPKVEYSLTPLAESLIAALDPLCLWGEQHATHLAARRGYTLETCEETASTPTFRNEPVAQGHA
jgi:DNA-binding HxlR family transcriptional regulator